MPGFCFLTAWTLHRTRSISFSGILFALQTGALLIGGATGNATTALLYLAIAGSIGRIIQLGVLFKISGVGIKRSLVPFSKYGIRSLPGLALIVASLQFGSATYTFAATLLGGLLYVLLSVKDVLAAFKPAAGPTVETSSDDGGPQALEKQAPKE